MNNTLEYVTYLNAVKIKTAELGNLLSNGTDYKLNEVLQSYTSMFNRFCPYQVGDRIKLKSDLNISDNSGWQSSKHFLIKGAIATVKDCGYRNDYLVTTTFYSYLRLWGVPPAVLTGGNTTLEGNSSPNAGCLLMRLWAAGVRNRRVRPPPSHGRETSAGPPSRTPLQRIRRRYSVRDGCNSGAGI